MQHPIRPGIETAFPQPLQIHAHGKTDGTANTAWPPLWLRLKRPSENTPARRLRNRLTRQPVCAARGMVQQTDTVGLVQSFGTVIFGTVGRSQIEADAVFVRWAGRHFLGFQIYC